MVQRSEMNLVTEKTLVYLLVYVSLVLFSDFVNSKEQSSLHLARAKFEYALIDKGPFDEYSDTYIIMHKRIYDSDAYQTDFRFIDGVASKNKAHLMYNVFNKNTSERADYLVIMVYYSNEWHVKSIGTYSLKMFKKNF